MNDLATLSQWFDGFHRQLQSVLYPFIWLDLVFVFLITWWMWRFLRHTRAERIIWGLIILGIIWATGQLLDLQIVNFVLRTMFISILVAFPVVFQPELRAALERIGRSTQLVADWRHLTRKELQLTINEVIKAVQTMAHNKIGALIVITRQVGLKEFTTNSQILNADVSARLLVAIFSPQSPLHDGAAIINGCKIVAARSTLPLYEEEIDLTIGTRHKAALGLSSQTDAIVIIISEERREISLSYDGKLIRKMSLAALKTRLNTLLITKRPMVSFSWRNILHRPTWVDKNSAKVV